MSPRADAARASRSEVHLSWRVLPPFAGAVLAVVVAALMVVPAPVALHPALPRTALAHPAGGGLGWTNISSAIGTAPPGSASAGFAYDPALNGSLLFGGCVSGVQWYSTCTPTNETWLFNGSAWTQLHPENAPSPRYYTMMTYDAADGYMLLFGGNASGGPWNGTNGTGSGFLGDTWEFSQGNWHQLQPSSSPSPRAAAGMAYDVADHEVVLYGGESYRVLLNQASETYAGSDTNDTWTYSGGVWTQIFPHTNPGPRDSFPMTYDPNSSSVMLFGGFTWSGGGGNYGDTWEFAAGAWQQVALAGSAAYASNNAALAADPALGGPVLFGGHYQYSYYGTTLVFNGSTWNRDLTNASPSPRWSSSFSYDAASDCLVLFGGTVPIGGASSPAQFFNDTWIFGSGCGATGSGGSIGGSGGGNNSGGSGGGNNSGGSGGGNNSGGNHSGGSGNGSGSSGSGSGNGSGSSGSGSGSGNGSGNPDIPALSVAASLLSRSGTTTVTVTFTTSISGGVPGYVVVWKFGDGSYGSALPGGSIAHTYTAPGTYRPSVTVTDAHGSVRTVSLATVVVPALPLPASVGLLASLSPGVLIDLLAGTILGMIGASMLYLHRRQATYRALAQEGAALVRALRETDNSL